MLTLLFIFLVFNTGIQMQNKYDYCKSMHFESDYCETQRTLSKY